MTEAWSHAATVAALVATDPGGLGGVTLRAPAGEARNAWLGQLQSLLPDGTPWRRLPPSTGEGRLSGGLDLAATLWAGRPVAERGLLSEADGGFIIAAMAERLGTPLVGPLGAALDTGEVLSERDGLSRRNPAQFGLILLDEGLEDECAPPALAERLAFVLTLEPRAGTDCLFDLAEVEAARRALPCVTAGPGMIDVLCETSLALGVASMRALIFAVRCAKAAAALDGRDTTDAGDAALAAALVLAPRATQLPPQDTPNEDMQEDLQDEDLQDDAPDTGQPEEESPEAPDPAAGEAPGDPAQAASLELGDQVIEAAKAAIPAGLLAALSARGVTPKRALSPGRAGEPRASQQRGRPVGVRHGAPGRGARLALVETLRAAAPWQTLRRREQEKSQSQTSRRETSDVRVLVRREDFRIARYQQKSETTTIFVVDASGSAALNRLAEVKGAVELILAECYIRRDSVALIAFRGTKAELILPPTRSLARAKRALAGQAGGGGTPLALAIDTACLLAATVRRKGPVPMTVFLTDGRANILRDGRAGRPEAEAEAIAAARAARAMGLDALLIDISPRPNAAARELAAAMGGRYLPLPYADARVLSQAVMGA